MPMGCLVWLRGSVGEGEEVTPEEVGRVLPGVPARCGAQGVYVLGTRVTFSFLLGS